MGTYNHSTHSTILIHKDTKNALLKLFPHLKVKTYDEALRVLVSNYQLNPYA
jgi:hypothetical protein